MANKTIHIFGGGTVSYVRTHLALCAPAYGTAAKQLANLCHHRFPALDIVLHLSKMAGGEYWQTRGEPAIPFETYEDLEQQIDEIVADPATKIVIMNAAIVDFMGDITQLGDDGHPIQRGKYAPRLKSRAGHEVIMQLHPYPKLLRKIRQERKDIFLVAFKETSGATEDEQYIDALNLCKEASVNLVLANDPKTRNNIIVTPEEARYKKSDREQILQELVEMTYHRSHLTFTRSTVVDGQPVPWDSEDVPHSLRTIVDFCIEQGAYKPFRGVTAGHFACKLDDTTFLTSIRKTDFNDLPKNGLVKVKTDGPDTVIAYGSKPSVGGQSQRIVFNDHPEYDCIVHFHCPLKKDGRNVDSIPIVSQREYECGSHECGQNTSRGLAQFVLPSPLTNASGRNDIGPNNIISVVYLDHHGPNIVFNRNIDPQLVIEFIRENFDLGQKTGGYVSLGQILRTPNHLTDLRTYAAQETIDD